MKDRHARPKRRVSRAAVTRAPPTASSSASKDGQATCAMFPFARKVNRRVTTTTRVVLPIVDKYVLQ